MDYKSAELVIVQAGKYKGLVMMVVGSEETGVYVSDGRHRKLEKPKKLNPKHVKRFGASLNELPRTNKMLWREIRQNVRLDR